MNCKYSQESRMYYACALCSNKNICESGNAVVPLAHEANKMTNENIERDCTRQLIEISTEIRNAATDGKFSISRDGLLKPEIRKKLEEFGYKVEIGTQYNESYYSISWRETK